MEKQLTWKWNGVETPINKLNDSQLYTIKETLLKSKKTWFGKTKKEWLDVIIPILKDREKSNIYTINNEIINRRIRNIQLKANYIVNNMIKSSKQTLSIKSLYEGEVKAN